MWGGPRIGRTPPPGPSTPRRSPPSGAASPTLPARSAFTLLGRTSSRAVVRPAHLSDYDCSGEEEETRRSRRARASDLWTQPGNGGGGGDGAGEEEAASASPQNTSRGVEEEEEAAANNIEEEEGQVSPRASAQHAAEEVPIVVHRPLLVIAGDGDDEGDEEDGVAEEGIENIVEVRHQEVEPEVAGEEQQRADQAGGGGEEGEGGREARRERAEARVPQPGVGGGVQQQGDDNVNGAAEGGEREVMNLGPWLDPEVPLPAAIPGTASSWDRVKELGGWECGLSPFPAMKNVPGAFREKWGRLMSMLVRRVLEADTEEATTTALLWFLVAPQAWLRQSGRGGKKGQDHAALARRFDAIIEEDWGSVLGQLIADKEEVARKEGRGKGRPKEVTESEAKEREREEVLHLMSRGQVGRAARRISSNGVASMDDPETKAALRKKYKPRSRDLPQNVSQGKCVDSLAGLREFMLSLEQGVSPGTGGMRNEYIICLAEVWGPEEMAMMEEFGMRYLTAQLPPWFYRVWGAVSTASL